MAQGRDPLKAMRDVKRAVRKYNSAVRQYNSDVREYNSEVRRFNRQQRSNRNQLEAAVRDHNRSVKRQRSPLSASTSDLFRSYEDLRGAVDDDFDGGGLVDLAAGEAAASLRALSAVEEDETGLQDAALLKQSAIADELSSLSEDLDARWRGALFSLSPDNPDAARHFCTSAREVVVQMIDGWASDEQVVADDPDCERTEQGRPSRRAKVRYLVSLKLGDYDSVVQFVEDDVKDVLALFRVFNDGTHGRAGRFDIHKLVAIKERVEGAIVFLSRLLR